MSEEWVPPSERMGLSKTDPGMQTMRRKFEAPVGLLSISFVEWFSFAEMSLPFSDEVTLSTLAHPPYVPPELTPRGIRSPTTCSQCQAANAVKALFSLSLDDVIETSLELGRLESR